MELRLSIPPNNNAAQNIRKANWATYNVILQTCTTLNNGARAKLLATSTRMLKSKQETKRGIREFEANLHPCISCRNQ